MTPEERSLSVAADRNNENALRALIHARMRKAASAALVELRARQKHERKRHGEHLTKRLAPNPVGGRKIRLNEG